MSSDSEDPDEFFDAEDIATPTVLTDNVTPSTHLLENVATPKFLADSSDTGGLNQEAQKLEAAQKHRLETQEKQASERKAAEAAERRLKLAAMREAIEHGVPNPAFPPSSPLSPPGAFTPASPLPQGAGLDKAVRCAHEKAYLGVAVHRRVGSATDFVTAGRSTATDHLLSASRLSGSAENIVHLAAASPCTAAGKPVSPINSQSNELLIGKAAMGGIVAYQNQRSTDSSSNVELRNSSFIESDTKSRPISANNLSKCFEGSGIRTDNISANQITAVATPAKGGGGKHEGLGSKSDKSRSKAKNDKSGGIENFGFSDLDAADELMKESRPMTTQEVGEPDIVTSTKSATGGSLGRSPPPRPIAPPRRKKKGIDTGSEACGCGDPEDSERFSPDSSVSNRPVTPLTGAMGGGEICGARAGLATELGRMFSLPGAVEGVEPELDISSATKGHRLVTACEDLSVRSPFGGGDPDPGDLPPTDDVDGRTSDEGASSPIPLTSDDFTAAQKLSQSEEGDEGGVIQETAEALQSESRPTDEEILDQVLVVNLDTGESLPLSSAEEKLPQCINPLSLHIMRRTKEYSDSTAHKDNQSEDEASRDAVCMPKTISKPAGRKKAKLKRFFGKTVHKIRSKADEVFHGEETPSDEEEPVDARRSLRVKASHAHKGPYDFDLLVLVQELIGQSAGAVWTMKFSHCGRLLATGGQDSLLRVWVLKDHFSFFDDMRQKYTDAAQGSPTGSPDSRAAPVESTNASALSHEGSAAAGLGGTTEEGQTSDLDADHMPFMKEPFCIYKGHSADLLDISWSKNYFILSSSMDKTVRLWHISRQECLCCFQHIDFVTAIAFHPKDDRYFLSGSLDGKLRLWNIPDKRVALWNEVTGATKLITAANFCLNGRFAVVGTYDGRCVIYNTEQLKYYTQIHVRSTRGKNARGRKITGVEPYPGEDKILVTSNDSRIRLYDLRDLTLTCKYKGCTNNSSQIKACFSYDGKYIICGSEDRFVYIWRTQHEVYKFSSARRDRNDFWESVKAHNAVVTNAIFAPNPELIIRPQFAFVDSDDRDNTLGVRGEVLVSADYNGAIKVFINKFKPSPV